MKRKTSVSLSDETLALADSIATASERSRSWIIEKAIQLGLPSLDSPEAQKLRKERPGKRSDQFPVKTETAKSTPKEQTPLQRLNSALQRERKLFSERFTPEWWDAMCARDKEDTDLLASYGWFISIWETPLATLHKAANSFRAGRVAATELVLVRHFANFLPSIESELQSLFPARQPILASAFAAHKNGDFALSIPVMLAQADGIGYEAFGISPYSTREENQSALKNLARRVSDTQSEADLHGIVGSLLPINAPEKTRHKFIYPLNRHLVLHGIATDYANEKNAAKAVSWLQFVAAFARRKFDADSRSTRPSKSGLSQA